LALNVAGDFVGSLSPISAGAKLTAAGVKLSLDGINELLVSQRTLSLDAASYAWTSGLGAFPVRNYTLAAAVLGPVKKLVASAAMTRETALHANGEAVISALLREDAAIALDSSLFSTTAASSSRPAGLLNGVTPITATTGGGTTAMNADLGKLAAAIAAAGGHVENIAFVAAATSVRSWFAATHCHSKDLAIACIGRWHDCRRRDASFCQRL
jgi:hypothetical protein